MTFQQLHTTRPKSAPARNFRSRSVSGVSGKERLRSDSHVGNGEPETLEDTMNKFHTTQRWHQRLEQRRRTEADILINEKPAGIMAMELPGRKMSRLEVDNVLMRVCQPTASYSARVAFNRRIEKRDIYVPPPSKHVVQLQYYQFEPERFKGTRPLSDSALKALVDRLSSYDAERLPPDSRRSLTPDIRKRMGPLCSYRWSGLKDC